MSQNFRTAVYSYVSRSSRNHRATSVQSSYSDNCYYRVAGLIRSIGTGRRGGGEVNLKNSPARFGQSSYTPGGGSLYTPARYGDIFRDSAKLSLQIVRHEPENFAVHGSLTSLRQTFWTELERFARQSVCRWCQTEHSRARVSEEEPVVRKAHKESRKTSTLKCWTSPGRKALRRLITFMMKETRQRFKRKWIPVTYVLFKRVPSTFFQPPAVKRNATPVDDEEEELASIYPVESILTRLSLCYHFFK